MKRWNEFSELLIISVGVFLSFLHGCMCLWIAIDGELILTNTPWFRETWIEFPLLMIITAIGISVLYRKVKK